MSRLWLSIWALAVGSLAVGCDEGGGASAEGDAAVAPRACPERVCEGRYTVYPFDLDNQLSELEGCTTLRGSLTLWAWAQDAEGQEVPYDFSPLACLQTVGGLDLRGSIKSLAGLSALKSVGGLTLYEVAYLTDLKELTSLTTVGALHIEGCPDLTRLDGLPSVTTLGWLMLGHNPKLASLAGLSALTSVIGSLHISGHLNLCRDEVDALVTRLDQPPESTFISGNSGPCP